MSFKTVRTLCDIFGLIKANKAEKKNKTQPSFFDNIINMVGNTVVSSSPEIQINKDTIIRNKFHSGYARTKDINWFVIHGTAGKGTLHWMQYLVKPTSTRGLNYSKGIGLFHYLIQTDGTIWEIIDPTKWTWHASIGQFDGGTIGVELENTSTRNADPYTSEQYNSLLNLYNYLRNENQTMDVMISHNRAKIKINNGTLGGKECPGKGFDWQLWMNMVSQNYSFKHNNNESLWDITPSI